MTNHEQEQHQQQPDDHLGATSPLPPELVEAIKDRPYACVTSPTDRGTVFVIKAPGHEIESVRGPVPILVQHELFQHPAAPVIRTVILIYDQPARPLALESFINVGDPQQRDDFAALARQPELDLLFYDETLSHRLSKQVHNSAPEAITRVLEQAEQFLAGIPRESFDFDRAKEEVMRTVEWPPGPY